MNRDIDIKIVKDDISQISDEIKGIVSDGGRFYLRVTGCSMLPFLKPERDTAILSAPDHVKVYETVLYKREQGNVVLHRVVAEHGDFFDFCGDNQVIVEKNVPKSTVIAVMREYMKRDKVLSCNKSSYKIRAFMWVKLRGVRHFFRKVKIKLTRSNR